MPENKVYRRRIRKPKSMLDRVFGRWTVIGYAGLKGHTATWLCQCECGTQRIVAGSQLRNGNSKSCGCLKNELVGKRASARTGALNYGWKGGRYTDNKGYIRTAVKDHPRASKQGYIFEHIIVMEKHLGRYLLPRETVHHRNGIRNDNRIENLELMVLHPRGQTVSDLVIWAKEVLERYEHTSFGSVE